MKEQAYSGTAGAILQSGRDSTERPSEHPHNIANVTCNEYEEDVHEKAHQ